VPDTDKRELSAAELAEINGVELAGGPVPWYPKHLLFRRDFSGGQMARDLTLFVDDDGCAYHVYASEDNGTLHISRLSDDYLSPAGKFIRVLPGRFNEAPAMLKYDGKYFLFTSDCTGWAPNPARLLVADAIFGEWRELGIRVSARANSSPILLIRSPLSFCPCWTGPMLSFSWPTAGIRRTRLMAAMSGYRLYSNMACRPFPGMTPGI
jgi:hypothetical protein